MNRNPLANVSDFVEALLGMEVATANSSFAGEAFGKQNRHTCRYTGLTYSDEAEACEGHTCDSSGISLRQLRPPVGQRDGRLAYKPILAVLEECRQRIAEAF
jgi:hypothetical protein